jgi:hypothetical protein
VRDEHGAIQHSSPAMILHSSPNYSIASFGTSTEKPKTPRTDYFRVRGDKIHVYKFVCCIRPDHSKGATRSLKKEEKSWIVARRLYPVKGSYFDRDRGGWVHSESFKFMQFVAKGDCGLTQVSMSLVIKPVTVFEDFDKPGDYFVVTVV